MAAKPSRKPLICSATCFTIFIIISLLTHIAEVFLNSVYIYYLHTQTFSAGWTATTLGFLLLPVVITQLFSAILHLQWRAANSRDTKDTYFIAVVHVLQLGFIWRHLKILSESNSRNKKKFFADLLLLRLVFAFTSGLPLLFLQAHYIINGEIYHGIQVAAMTVTLLSTAWALASFRRQNECCEVDKVILTWPGILFKLLWRIGEITARILSLAVFIGSYNYWIFLVFGLHWLSMIICVWTSILGALDFKDFGRCSQVMVCLAIGYVYIFNHINFSNIRAKYRYTIYYGIIFFETCVLVAAWILNTPSWNELPGTYYLIAAIVSAFAIGIISMVVYYGCFHIQLTRVPAGNSDVCIQDGCINCRLSLCAKHSQVLQRPFNSGWVSPYDQALYKGHYFKNMMQDSLFDSTSELEDRAMSNSSVDGREVESILKSPNLPVRQAIAVANPAYGRMDKQNGRVSSEAPLYRRRNPSCHHNEFSKQRLKAETVPASMLELSLPANADCHKELVLEVPPPSQIIKDNTSIVSTLKRTLNGDIINNLDDPQEEKSQNYSSFSKDRALTDTMSLPSSLLHMESDQWYSDSYTTDNSLGGYNLPVTCLVSETRETTLRPPYTISDNTDIVSLDSGQGSDRKTPQCKSQRSLSSFKQSVTPFVDHSDPESVTIHTRTKGNNSENITWYDCSVSGESAFPQVFSSEISSYSFDSDSDGSPEMII